MNTVRVVRVPLLEYMAKFKQAGAIVVRAGKTGPRILLVTARRNPRNWIFPKGHVELGETLKVAAVREAREEAGVEGKVVSAAGKMSFEFDDNSYRVTYFVVTTNDPGKEREGRRLRWLKYKQALRWLTYEETRDLLRDAWPRIKVAVATRSRGSRKKK
jgi:8-oxo-dGTP pyrophosphatase MutT (NUDIX family)